MHGNNRKLIFAVTLLLVLSQWLSLAHATEHLLGGEDTRCQICTLQHQFQSAAPEMSPAMAAAVIESVLHKPGPWHYKAAPITTRTIRAPPQPPSI